MNIKINSFPAGLTSLSNQTLIASRPELTNEGQRILDRFNYWRDANPISLGTAADLDAVENGLQFAAVRTSAARTTANNLDRAYREQAGVDEQKFRLSEDELWQWLEWNGFTE